VTLPFGAARGNPGAPGVIGLALRLERTGLPGWDFETPVPSMYSSSCKVGLLPVGPIPGAVPGRPGVQLNKSSTLYASQHPDYRPPSKPSRELRGPRGGRLGPASCSTRCFLPPERHRPRLRRGPRGDQRVQDSQCVRDAAVRHCRSFCCTILFIVSAEGNVNALASACARIAVTSQIRPNGKLGLL